MRRPLRPRARARAAHLHQAGHRPHHPLPQQPSHRDQHAVAADLHRLDQAAGEVGDGVAPVRQRVGAEEPAGIGQAGGMVGAAVAGADLGQIAVGVAEGKKILGAAKVRAGDVLIGLPSSGLHSNGYSLVRRVFEDPAEWASESVFSKPGPTLGEILLEPTKIYAGAIAAIRENPAVHAVAHITGGGLPGNVARIMPPGSQAVLNPPSWQLPGIFREIEKRGPVERAEMFRTFNMGLGMVIAVSPGGADGALAALAEAGETPCRAGEVREGKVGGAVRIEGVDL